jgi:hypothetical protein
MKIKISTSPRAIWVWARDVAETKSLREILTAAHCSFSDPTGKDPDPRILDLDIGIIAAQGLNALELAGYSFQWHPTQHELNREPTLLGVTVKE